MKSSFVGLLALILLLLGQPALAQVKYRGGYLSYSGNLVLTEENNGEFSGLDADISYKPGYVANVALGYGYRSGFRTEIEAGYGRLKFDKLESSGTTVDMDGAVTDVYTLTANVFFDFKTGRGSLVRPYIGGGVGLAHLETDDFTAGGVRIAGDSETDMTGFGEIGFGIPLAQGATLMPAYRYVWIDNETIEREGDRAHLFKVGLLLDF